MQPLDLMAKRAVWVSPPGFNLVRYHGIFTPGSRLRNWVVPFDPGQTAAHGCGCGEEKKKTGGKDSPKEGCCHPRNYRWAELLKREFEIDILERDRCGGRMKILCAVNPPDAIRKILDCLGLPSRPPPISPAVEENYFD
jgi:hypothetical protein